MGYISAVCYFCQLNLNVNYFFFSFRFVSVILNSTDFDFLLSKGAPNSGQNNPRDSILERFDPISGRKSFINLPSSLKSDATTTKLVPTILETSIAESTSSDGNEPLLPIQDGEKIIDFNTSIKLDQNNSGDGDYSQASSITETYEIASIEDPLKVNVLFIEFVAPFLELML